MKQLIIDLDEEHPEEYVVEEVLRLIKNGYTSGIDPTFEIIEVKE